MVKSSNTAKPEKVGSGAEPRKPAKKKQYQPVLIPAWCKVCGICAAFCPKGVYRMDDRGARIEKPDECIGCRFCEMHCPDFAISVKERDAGKGGAQ